MRPTRRQLLKNAMALGAMSLARPMTSGAQERNAFVHKRNWGRWGDDDQMGAVNLITPSKRASAAGLVKAGRAVSLSRVFAPAQHYFESTNAAPATPSWTTTASNTTA